jgi:hypothetical protein
MFFQSEGMVTAAAAADDDVEVDVVVSMLVDFFVDCVFSF